MVLFSIVRSSPIRFLSNEYWTPAAVILFLSKLRDGSTYYYILHAIGIHSFISKIKRNQCSERQLRVEITNKKSTQRQETLNEPLNCPLDNIFPKNVRTQQSNDTTKQYIGHLPKIHEIGPHLLSKNKKRKKIIQRGSEKSTWSIVMLTILLSNKLSFKMYIWRQIYIHTQIYIGICMNVYLTSDIHTYTNIHRDIHTYTDIHRIYIVFCVGSPHKKREIFLTNNNNLLIMIFLHLDCHDFLKGSLNLICELATNNWKSYECIYRCISVYVCISDVRYTFMHIPMYICVCMYIWRQVYTASTAK